MKWCKTRHFPNIAHLFSAVGLHFWPSGPHALPLGKLSAGSHAERLHGLSPNGEQLRSRDQFLYKPFIISASLNTSIKILQKNCPLTGSCKPITWTKHSNMNVDGGRSDSSSTLASCQSQCVANSDCTGIDWDGAASTKCWLHGSWNKGNPMKTKPGVDHHKLTRNPNCDGK